MKKLLLLTLSTGVGLSIKAEKITFSVNNKTDRILRVRIDALVSSVKGKKENCKGEVPTKREAGINPSPEKPHLIIEPKTYKTITIETPYSIYYPQNDMTDCYEYRKVAEQNIIFIATDPKNVYYDSILRTKFKPGASYYISEGIRLDQ